MEKTKWLDWAQKLQAHAQIGLNFATNPFEQMRYEAIKEIAADILSTYTELNYEKVKEFYDEQAGYATPKVDVRGVIFQNDQILLVKELADGGWTLPGGWVDVGEPPSLAVEREVWEKLGYKVRAEKLLALYDRNQHGHPPHPFHIYKLFFLCELIGGKAENSIETSDASFFAEDNIPPLSLGRTTPEELTRFYQHHRNPDLPTDFD